jgi:hypothetical protein
MRDFLRLREQLRLALMCAPMSLGACGSSPPPPEPIGNQSTAQDPPPVDVPWPAYHGCGSGGGWCAPRTQVARAAGTSSSAACAPSFAHAELSFSLDQDATQAKRAAGDADTCCYWYGDGCMKGRPLLDRGAPVVAPVRDGGGWARRQAAGAAAIPPAPLRDALAQAWLDDALVEHASVAAFARATLELMAVGAPAALLADCQRAALDELRHTEGCLALHERYAGRRVSPGAIPALPARPADLARLAVDTFVEGCVAETTATLAATRALASCRDPEVARFLDRLVRDETRHAALAWRTVAWAVGEGGARVADALGAAAAAIAPAPRAPGAAEPGLLAHGRTDDRTRREAVIDAWREIIAPTLADVLARAA